MRVYCYLKGRHLAEPCGHDTTLSHVEPSLKSLNYFFFSLKSQIQTFPRQGECNGEKTICERTIQRELSEKFKERASTVNTNIRYTMRLHAMKTFILVLFSLHETRTLRNLGGNLRTSSVVLDNDFKLLMSNN